MAAGKARFTLVVPHVPKTAGTSLRLLLEAVYGSGLLADYDDRPLQTPRWPRRAHALSMALHSMGRPLEHACVYGHFLPLKYLACRQARFAIWVRDPVQRVVSRYHHYRRAVAAGEQAHARWGLVPGLSLEQFACLPQYRNTYAEYLWAFPLRRFEFVGRVEFFQSDLTRFLARFGLPKEMDLPLVNSNPERGPEPYALDESCERLIRVMNQEDLRLYERLLAVAAP